MGNATSSNDDFSPVPYGEESPETGRRPLDRELLILFNLQQDLFTRLTPSSHHMKLLERYKAQIDRIMFNSHNNQMEQIQVQNKEWVVYGFLEDRPLNELKSGGLLGMKMLIYFVETYPVEAHFMLRRKILQGYPFVKAGLAVLRILCEAFYLIQLNGKKGNFAITPTLYWQILQTDLSFYQLFAFSFLCLDEHFVEYTANQVAKKQISSSNSSLCPLSVLTMIVEQGKAKLLEALKQAPRELKDLSKLSIRNGSTFFQTSPTSNQFSVQNQCKNQRRSFSQASISKTSIKNSLDSFRRNSIDEGTRRKMKLHLNLDMELDDSNSETDSSSAFSFLSTPIQSQEKNNNDLFQGMEIRPLPF